MAVLRYAVNPGIALGLFVPTLITHEAAAYVPLLVISIPAGIALAGFLCRALQAVMSRGGAAAGQEQETLHYIMKPFLLLPFGTLILVLPIPGIPFFMGAAICGIVYYRVFLTLRRCCRYQSATLECAGLCILFISAFVLLFQVNIIHDAFQYLCIVISLIKDGDLNFYREVYLLNTHRFYNPVAMHSARYLGVPLLETPFFIAGELLAHLMRLAGSFHIPNGMTFPYLFMVSLASPLFGWGALLLMYLLGREFFPRGISLTATAAYFLSSPLIFFVLCWNGWPHPFNTFFIALFLLYGKRTAGRKQIRDWIALGAIGGILCLIRPTNAILAIFPVYELASGFTKKAKERFSAVTGAGAGLLAAAVVFSPQLSIWKATGGSLLGGPYQEIGDYFDWLHPNFYGTLFATAQHGLFAWTPLLLPAALGLGLFVKKDRRFGWLAIILCSAHTYLYSCWSVWWTGIGFSNRFFVELSPFFILGFAALIEKAIEKIRSWEVAIAVCSLCALANLFLIGAYRANIVPYSIPDPARIIDKPLTFGAIWYNHLFVFPLSAGSLFTSQWSNENFFTERLIHAFSRLRPVEGSMVLIAALLCSLVFYGMARTLLHGAAGRKFNRIIMPALWATGLLIVLIHAGIAAAQRRTIPFSNFYHFTVMFKAVRQPAEDTWCFSTYQRPVIGLDLLTYLIYGFEIPQQEPVALVSVYDQSDRTFTYLLRAGIDTAEYAYLNPGLGNRIQHTVAQTNMARETITAAYSRYLYPATTYLTHLQFPEPITIKKIGIRYLAGNGELIIADIFARDF